MGAIKHPQRPVIKYEGNRFVETTEDVPQTDTKRARFSTGAERQVQDWDRDAGAVQRQNELNQRREMGQKMTPAGPKGGELKR